MKITRFLKSYAGLSLGLCLLGVGVTGCIKDEVTATKETTLTLRFSTRADGDAQGVRPETANEHMRTLRVILTEKNGTIRYNTKIDNIPEGDEYKEITFGELITVADGETKFDVYAIANEEAFVSSADELAAKSGNISQFRFDSKTLDATILQRLNAADKTKPQENEYIPQTAIQEVTVIPERDNSGKVQLKFVVAKIELSFTNQSPSDVQLGNVTFSNMNVANTPLFPATNLPSDGTNLEGRITVPGSTTNYTIVRYVYESQVTGSDNYILSTTWGNNSLNLTQEGLGTEFARGTKLDIDVTLNAEQEVSLIFRVVPWDDNHKIDVPTFQ